jgi:hypothetical protein
MNQVTDAALENLVGVVVATNECTKLGFDRQDYDGAEKNRYISARPDIPKDLGNSETYVHWRI